VFPERHAIWTASVTYEPATRALAPFTPSRRADGKMKPDAREIARQAATSVCAAFGFSTRTRLVGPEMLIAPTGRPSAPKIGAAMQLASGSVSPLSSAIPRLRTRASSRRHPAGEVIVFEASAGGFLDCVMGLTSSSGRNSAIAFPSAVEWTGDRPRA